jgi:hypothetical protein
MAALRGCWALGLLESLGMGSVWVGERVRLRAIEPEDWADFLRFDQDSEMQRNVDMVHAPQERLGFQREGHLRDHEFLAGAYQDVVVFGITAEEFGALHMRR